MTDPFEAPPGSKDCPVCEGQCVVFVDEGDGEVEYPCDRCEGKGWVMESEEDTESPTAEGDG